jgi:dihydrofolate reductase
LDHHGSDDRLRRALFKQFDTLLLGRRTFETMRRGGSGAMPGMTTIVVSRTLNPKDFPKTTIARDLTATIQSLKQNQGKDIWLFGGGGLFRSVLDAGLVDTVELAVVPILLSEGVPLLPPGARSPALQLTESRELPSGIVMLSYRIKK